MDGLSIPKMDFQKKNGGGNGQRNEKNEYDMDYGRPAAGRYGGM